MKAQFAYVNKNENFTFTFLPGVGNNDVYPGKLDWKEGIMRTVTTCTAKYWRSLNLIV